MRGLPRQVKGAGLRVLSRRSSRVQISSPAPYQGGSIRSPSFCLIQHTFATKPIEVPGAGLPTQLPLCYTLQQISSCHAGQGWGWIAQTMLGTRHEPRARCGAVSKQGEELILLIIVGYNKKSKFNQLFRLCPGCKSSGDFLHRHCHLDFCRCEASPG